MRPSFLRIQVDIMPEIVFSYHRKLDGVNIGVKSMVALASGAILLPGLLLQTAQAQSTLVESGTSVLADDVLTATGPEALTVSWFVVENTSSDIYTYSYNVNNPAGDVELPASPNPGAPETVGSFTVSFDTTMPGAFLSGTQPVPGSLQNDGASGLVWTFPSVSPGSSSALLAFQSALPPSPGNASASGGAIPPAPWSTYPAGTPIPVPRAVPEPAIIDLCALTALLLLPFSRTWCRLLRQSWESNR